jgi:hypothetical protein
VRERKSANPGRIAPSFIRKGHQGVRPVKMNALRFIIFSGLS